jgi:hypothetical protein
MGVGGHLRATTTVIIIIIIIIITLTTTTTMMMMMMMMELLAIKLRFVTVLSPYFKISLAVFFERKNI